MLAASKSLTTSAYADGGDVGKPCVAPRVVLLLLPPPLDGGGADELRFRPIDLAMSIQISQLLRMQRNEGWVGWERKE